MAVLLLDLVIARPQLHCKQRVLFDCTSKKMQVWNAASSALATTNPMPLCLLP